MNDLGENRGTGSRFAVYQEDLLQSAGDGPDPFDQLPLIGVAGQFIQARYFRPQTHRLAKQSDRRISALQQLAPEGVFGLKSGDEDGIARSPRCCCAWMVENASCFTLCAGGGNHQDGSVQAV